MPGAGARLGTLKDEVEDAGLRLAVVESIPVHEDIKLGRPGRDRLIDRYCASIASMGELRIPCCATTSCRCSTGRAPTSPCGCQMVHRARVRRPGARVIDLSRGTGELPGWAAAYSPAELQALLAAYRTWTRSNSGTTSAISGARRAGRGTGRRAPRAPSRRSSLAHLRLPRLITNARALERFVALVDSPANGVTFCTGSLGASPRTTCPPWCATWERAFTSRIAATSRLRVSAGFTRPPIPPPAAAWICSRCSAL